MRDNPRHKRQALLKKQKDRGQWFIQKDQRVICKSFNNYHQDKKLLLNIIKSVVLLKRLRHPNIVELEQIIIDYNNKGQIKFMFQPFLPATLKRLITSNRILEFSKIKTIVFQILLGLKYCQQNQAHSSKLESGDIFLSQNLNEVKIFGFGIHQQKPITTNKEIDERQQYWRRYFQSRSIAPKILKPPELIISQQISFSSHIWSVGFIFGQLLTMISKFQERRFLCRRVYFPLSPPKGKTQEEHQTYIKDIPNSISDQLDQIFGLIGTPTDVDFITDEKVKRYIRRTPFLQRRPLSRILDSNNISQQAQDFFQKCLQFDPKKRMTITEAIKHRLFDDIRGMFQVNLETCMKSTDRSLQELSQQQLIKILQLECSSY